MEGEDWGSEEQEGGECAGLHGSCVVNVSKARDAMRRIQRFFARQIHFKVTWTPLCDAHFKVPLEL